MKHPHYDLMLEWAADTSKTVQFYSGGKWRDVIGQPSFGTEETYRIKPDPKLEQVFDLTIDLKDNFRFPRIRFSEHWEQPNVRVTFDGEGNLKEIIKL